MTLADPVEYLNRLEQAINDGDYLAAQTFVRNCIESALKKLAIKNNISFNHKIRLQNLNKMLKDHDIVNNYWFNQLKTIVINTGNPASHSNLVDRSELIDSYNTIATFYETVVTDQLGISKVSFYSRRFPEFYFGEDETKLKRILGISSDPSDNYYPISSLNTFFQNLDTTSSGFCKILLYGSPGIGKTSALSYFGLKKAVDLHRILAVPKNLRNLQSLPNLIEKVGDSVIILIDDFDLDEDNISSFEEIDLNENHNIILIATQRIDDYSKVLTKIPQYNDFWTKKIQILPFKSNELSNKILDILKKKELTIDTDNQSEILDLLTSKSEGYFFYIKQVLEDLISHEKGTVTLQHIKELPKGIIPYVAFTYYNKFVDVPENIKNSKLQELEVLFLLSKMISNQFHEHLFEQILKIYLNMKGEDIDFNFDPSSFLIKSGKYYHFPHSIWKQFFHIDKNEWIPSGNNAELTPPYFKILSRLLENVKSKFTIDTLYDACKLAFETPYFKQNIPINLWISLIWQFPFIYHQRIVPFFEENISSDKFLEVLKSDCLDDKVKHYRQFVSIFITKFRETRDAGNYEWAVSNLKIASRLIEYLEFKDLRVQLLIAHSYFYKYRREFDLSLEKLVEAKEICEVNNLRKYLGDVYYNMATHLSEQEEYGEDIKNHLKKAREIYSEIKDEEGLVLIRLLESELLLNEGDLDGAIQTLEEEKSRVLGFDNPSSSLLLDLYFKLLEVYMNYPSTQDKALEYLDKAKELSVELLDIRKFTIIQFHLGQIAVHNREYDQANEHLIKTINSAKYMNDEKLKLFAQAVKADIHIRRKEYEIALDLLKDNLEIAESLYIQGEVMLAKRNLGRIYNYMNKKPKAKKFWNESYEIFKNRKDIISDDTFLWLIQYFEILLMSENDNVNEVYDTIEDYWKKLPEDYTKNKIIYQRYLRTQMNQYSNLAKIYSADPKFTKLSNLLDKQKKLQKIFEVMLDENENDFFALTTSGRNLFNMSVVSTMLYDIKQNPDYLEEALRHIRNASKLYESHPEVENAKSLKHQAQNFMKSIEDLLVQ